MLAQQMGQQPQPPKPPNPQLVAAAQGPAMEEILQQISSDVDRTFTINIQTSSTIDLDTAQDKGEVSEFMNALGQMLAGLQPLMSFGPPGVETIKALLSAVCQRYKFGIPVVDIIATIQPPPPPKPGPDPKQQAEIQKIQMESQAREKELQQEAQMAQQELVLTKQELEGKLQLMQAELEISRQELAMRMQEMNRKEELAQAQHQRAMLTATMPPATVQSKPRSQNAPVRR
jgi:hypothetical protein